MRSGLRSSGRVEYAGRQGSILPQQDIPLQQGEAGIPDVPGAPSDPVPQSGAPRAGALAALGCVPPPPASANLVSWMPAAASMPAPDPQADLSARARAEVAAGERLYRQGQFRAALGHYREAVRLRPSEPLFHYKLACAAWKSNLSELVEPHLCEAVRLDPRHAVAHDGLGQWYLQAGDLPRALEHSAEAVRLAPGRGDLISSRAEVLAAAGQPREAWALIAPMIAAGSEDPQLLALFALIAPKVGQEERAAELILRVAGGAASGVLADERPEVHFTAAGLLDRLGRYDEAFEQARRGNDAVRAARRPHDPEAHARAVSRHIDYFSPDRMESLPRARHGDRRPVFIVGMPRSGTSLLEQILAGHPQVCPAGELPALSRIAGALSGYDWSEGERFPECLDRLCVRRANALAAEYLAALDDVVRQSAGKPTTAQTASARPASARPTGDVAAASSADAVPAPVRYVTDKMPCNCFFLGLAEVLLPGCHVIHCVRNPLDTCLSCYMTNFAFGNDFSFDLGHLGAYYRDYQRVMDHWKRVLGLPILEMRYEDLALDTEGQTRRLLDFLGLPWDERCVNFHENRRRVHTSSTDQVRRPAYASSIGRWQHYERHLTGLIRSLRTPPHTA